MTFAIKTEGLSKKYVIGHQRQENYQTLRDALMHQARGLAQRIRHPLSPNRETTEQEELWALKDVDLEIAPGEKVGIIGRNGAGKTTLLKLLSRITEPTAGKFTLNGRVASLLEVGTGFHPELTGRENVFLNGAILGMSRAEVRAKFDEIVDFAEVERFLDTPVKRYSSGMYVRLAFAVAAHLEPEILIVDEVLAVGDTVFQKKCIERMLEVSSQGGTILLVSHNFSAIKAICNRAMLFERGQLTFSGPVEETIENYLGNVRLSGREMNLESVERTGVVGELIFSRVTFQDFPIHFGKPIKIRAKLKMTGLKRVFSELDFGFAIQDKNQNTIIHCSNRYLNRNFDHTQDEDEYFLEIENILKPGIYSLVMFLRSQGEIQDWLRNAVKFEVEDGNPYGFHDTRQIQGAVLPNFSISLSRRQ